MCRPLPDAAYSYTPAKRYNLNTKISYFVSEMRNNCAREGGFCINIIPPPLPRRRWNRRRGPARGRMPRTKTKKGTRNNRGRGAAGAGAGAGPGPGMSVFIISAKI